MSYFVTLSFDLTEAKSDDYNSIQEELENLGLYGELQGKQNKIELPDNTFAGEFNGENAIAVRDFVNQEIKQIIKSNSIKSTYFISVGSGWTWIKGNT